MASLVALADCDMSFKDLSFFLLSAFLFFFVFFVLRFGVGTEGEDSEVGAFVGGDAWRSPQAGAEEGERAASTIHLFLFSRIQTEDVRHKKVNGNKRSDLIGEYAPNS